MKKFIIVVIALFLGNTCKAQMIKSFDCVKTQKDSVLTYDLEVKFDSFGEEEKRIELVKVELEKLYQVKRDRIISIESFPGKMYLTYRYRIKIKNK